MIKFSNLINKDLICNLLLSIPKVSIKRNTSALRKMLLKFKITIMNVVEMQSTIMLFTENIPNEFCSIETIRNGFTGALVRCRKIQEEYQRTVQTSTQLKCTLPYQLLNFSFSSPSLKATTIHTVVNLTTD